MQSRIVLRPQRLVSPGGIGRSPFFVGNLVSSSHTPATLPRGTAAISARWQSTQTSPSTEQAEAPGAPYSDAPASHDAAGSDGQERLRQRLYDQIIRVNQVRSAHHMCLRWALHVVVLTAVLWSVCTSRPESWERSRSTPGSCSSCAVPPTSLSCRYSLSLLVLFDALNVREMRVTNVRLMANAV
jgi:hypothetical protein